VQTGFLRAHSLAPLRGTWNPVDLHSDETDVTCGSAHGGLSPRPWPRSQQRQAAAEHTNHRPRRTISASTILPRALGFAPRPLAGSRGCVARHALASPAAPSTTPRRHSSGLRKTADHSRSGAASRLAKRGLGDPNGSSRGRGYRCLPAGPRAASCARSVSRHRWHTLPHFFAAITTNNGVALPGLRRVLTH
jgi:hypothetical protein